MNDALIHSMLGKISFLGPYVSQSGVPGLVETRLKLADTHFTLGSERETQVNALVLSVSEKTVFSIW